MIKKMLLMLAVGVICGSAGCYIPHPSNRVGVRTLQPVERWEKECRETVLPGGEKVKRCKWVQSR